MARNPDTAALPQISTADEATAARIAESFSELERRMATVQGEAEVRIQWLKAIENALLIDMEAERHRKDANYNNVIIEFKDKGFFKGKEGSPSFIEAKGQLLKYITAASARDGLPKEDYHGIALDGVHLSFAHIDASGDLCHQPLIPFGRAAFNLLLSLVSTGHRRAFVSDNLIADFGHGSRAGRFMMQALASALSNCLQSNSAKDIKVRMLFEEWRTLYGQAADLSIQQATDIDASLGFAFPDAFAQGHGDELLAAKLFVAHTFHSLLVKVVAAEIAAAHGLASGHSPSVSMSAGSDEELLAAMERDIERGGFFDAVGIHGFVEEVIFGWWLDACKSEAATKAAVCDALRMVLSGLCRYRFDKLPASGKSRDVLRDFYQNVVPEQLRKSLGEFYTPDWLVAHTIDKAEVSGKDWLAMRVLDPTCGSGSFLLEAIARKREQAQAAGLTKEETLDLLLASVWGFDLNPLAVQSARVNFLIAVADLVGACKGKDIEIPVLLADAVYSPAPDPTGEESIVRYKIGSQNANLDIALPSELALDRPALDAVFRVMGELVEENSEWGAAEEALVSSGVVPAGKVGDWRSPLRTTYEQVLALHRKEWNGIWFRIVRNFFWSATAGRFGLVVGNPPWVRWSNLPEAYRNRVKDRCRQYDIFSENGFHGGNELDISAMITYTAADKWLEEGGKLAFVITQTVFQSPSSQGFRRFRIDDEHAIAPLSIDDMKELKPFPDAANKTAVALFVKRRDAVAFPVPYVLWRGLPAKDAKGKPKMRNGLPVLEKTVDPSLSLSSVIAKVVMEKCEAWPVSDESFGAPWSIMPPGRHSQIKGLFGESKWVMGRKGITTDLNGVFFVEQVGVRNDPRQPSGGVVRVRTRPQEGKTKLGQPREFDVEPDLLYPLVKGAADFESCFLNPKEELLAFVPNKGITSADFTAATTELRGLRKTSAFFKSHQDFLANRSTYRARMKEMGAPLCSVYNVGEYTFAPFKVLWPEMSSSFCSAVATTANVPLVGSRPYVPDHKVFFVSFTEEAPAYFLCGLLNAPLVREMVHSHLISTQMGNIFKHINLPPFMPDDTKHVRLSNLVKQAHQEPNAEKRRVVVVQVEALANDILGMVLAERMKAA